MSTASNRDCDLCNAERERERERIAAIESADPKDLMQDLLPQLDDPKRSVIILRSLFKPGYEGYRRPITELDRLTAAQKEIRK